MPKKEAAEWKATFQVRWGLVGCPISLACLAAAGGDGVNKQITSKASRAVTVWCGSPFGLHRRRRRQTKQFVFRQLWWPTYWEKYTYFGVVWPWNQWFGTNLSKDFVKWNWLNLSKILSNVDCTQNKAAAKAGNYGKSL
jgi:hypothetical protein